MKNTKTPFMRILRRLAIISNTSKQTGISTDELIQREQALFSRRDFLETTAKAGAVIGIASTFPMLSSCKTTNENDNNTTDNVIKQTQTIAIIGGGMAGLNACHTLKKNGFTSTIYEASTRTGGRMLSAHNVMGNNLVTEFGGEYIDTNHKEMFALMKEFNLETLDTFPSIKDKALDDIFIDGKHYTTKDAITEFNKMNKTIEADLEKIGDNYEIGSYADKLDQLSIDEYLSKFTCKNWFKKFIQVAYESEFGYSTAELSSLNLITFIGTDTSKGEFKYFGDSDERYKVKGGNQQVVDKLAFAHKENILKEHVLTQIDQIDKQYQLTFANGKKVTADFVILAIPFTTLRKVKLNVTMSEEKKNAIEQLKYGTNAKFMFGVDKRVWRAQGYGGYLFNNLVQNGWDNSLAQNNDEGYGGYTVFLGGKAGNDLNKADKEKYIDGVDKAYPGTKAAHNGKTAFMLWPSQPYTLGSYACFTKGQIVRILPHIATPIDNIFFAGEHCSEEFQGFMEGAAETGKAAAEQVLEKIKITADN
ncbi:MAG: FAD-dependent oxidoreductase [Bacteroidetes bacterium]|nr:FAD-dependent oxidoreductase [Bacteroidota bacterium]